MSAASNIKPPFRDRIIPWYFVMAFLVIFVVNGIFIYQATSTHTGLVTQQAYEKGLSYDKISQDANAQAALGWQSDMTLKESHLQFVLNDAHGEPVVCEQAIAHVMRPTQDGHDFSQPLTRHLDGSYQSSLAFSQPGQWDITVSVLCKQQPYQQRQRVIVQ